MDVTLTTIAAIFGILAGVTTMVIGARKATLETRAMLRNLRDAIIADVLKCQHAIASDVSKLKHAVFGEGKEPPL